MTSYKNGCVIIPAYNESESISRVIWEVKKLNKRLSIIVVNDGSTDKTSKICKKIKGVNLIDHPFNLGIGAAVQTGLQFALSHNFKYAVQIDADGQHNPKDLSKFFQYKKSQFDLIIGSRFIKKTNYKMPLGRYIGINLISALIKISCGQKIYDPTSGFRLYGPRTIKMFSQSYPLEFPEPRSIVEAVKQGFKIKEISTNMRQRITGKSSISNIYSLFIFIPLSLSILLESFKTKQNE